MGDVSDEELDRYLWEWEQCSGATVRYTTTALKGSNNGGADRRYGKWVSCVEYEFVWTSDGEHWV